MEQYKLIHGDCIEEMKKMADNSVDAIVTDPPYELGFMNKSWDKSGIANNINVWKQAYRVLKPGGHMLAFSGTRTYHRMVCAIEDAGFEIRDQLAWIYGSGFPKSKNMGVMVDKKNGVKARGKAIPTASTHLPSGKYATEKLTGNEWAGVEYKPETDEAKKWNGWGTALKPAQEPIVLARKPLAENTVAKNVIKYGTGAININDCRIKTQKGDEPSAGSRTATFGTQETISGGDGSGGWEANNKGRWPANIIHDGSDEVLEIFPISKDGVAGKRNKNGATFDFGTHEKWGGYGGGGSAARFFYCAKANKQDRDEGLDDFEDKYVKKHIIQNEGRKDAGKMETSFPRKNNHPTVKPTTLMQYLIKLITPKHGVVLDPFMGSGSTGKAAMLLGNKFIGIDMTKEYIPIAENRISHALSEYKKEHISDAFFDNV